MIKKISAPLSLKGEITLPGDKSISHRAAILNSIAMGSASVTKKATITNFSPGADCLSTVTCLRAMGVKADFLATRPHGSGDATTLEIWGRGEEGLSEPEDVLDAGNSGTTMRLLTGLLASQPFLSIITGDDSLRSRPMSRIVQPLRLMGASIWGRKGDSLAPLVIKGGNLHGITYLLPVASAQLKSALLLAGLFATGETIIEEPIISRDHTEGMLKAMGAKINTRGCHITLAPLTHPLNAVDLRIPGDISSAACWLVAGALHPDACIRIKDVGVNPTRSGIIDILLEMGANLSIENQREEGGEPIADLVIESSKLSGMEISGDMIPRAIDELPLLAVAAAVAQGTTIIRGAGELRAKETDRITTTMAELSRLGANIEELPDGMIITGGAPLEGRDCLSHNDHRLAMALGVAGLIARGETTIHESEAVDISYPSFWQDMELLTSRRGSEDTRGKRSPDRDYLHH